jgi:hypothetical protein
MTTIWCVNLGRDWQRVSNNQKDSHVKRHSLKELNKAEGKEECHVEISSRFADWESVGENIPISAKDAYAMVR